MHRYLALDVSFLRRPLHIGERGYSVTITDGMTSLIVEVSPFTSEQENNNSSAISLSIE